MDCENILHIIGDVASIITVIGGLYGLIKWIQSRQAKVILTEYKHSDQCLYIAYVYNKGLATAYKAKHNRHQNIRLKPLHTYHVYNLVSKDN